MLSPEIQKNILNESMETKKENQSLLNLKRQRQRTKPKKSSLNNRKCAKKKLDIKNEDIYHKNNNDIISLFISANFNGKTIFRYGEAF